MLTSQDKLDIEDIVVKVIIDVVMPAFETVALKSDFETVALKSDLKKFESKIENRLDRIENVLDRIEARLEGVESRKIETRRASS